MRASTRFHTGAVDMEGGSLRTMASNSSTCGRVIRSGYRARYFLTRCDSVNGFVDVCGVIPRTFHSRVLPSSRSAWRWEPRESRLSRALRPLKAPAAPATAPADAPRVNEPRRASREARSPRWGARSLPRGGKRSLLRGGNRSLLRGGPRSLPRWAAPLRPPSLDGPSLGPSLGPSRLGRSPCLLGAGRWYSPLSATAVVWSAPVV